MSFLRRVADAYCKSKKYWTQVLKTRSPRASYIGGWLEHNNLGDEALFDAACKMFSQVSLVNYPTVGGRILKFPNEILKPCEFGVLAGGTLINSGISYLTSFKEAVSFFEDVIVFGTGVRAPYFWEEYYSAEYANNLLFWKKIADQIKYFGVRGPISAEILNSYGFNNVEVIGDPVIILALDEIPVSLNKTIGINIGDQGDEIWGKDPYGVAKKYIDIAILLKSKGWEVHWYIVSPRDEKITKHCAEKSGTMANVEYHYTDYNFYLESVAKMAVFIGMKLHAVILAMCAYIPSIMIEYRPKCLDYMQSVEQHEYNIRCDKINIDRVLDFINFFEENHQKYRALLYSKMNYLKLKQIEKANLLQNEILLKCQK